MTLDWVKSNQDLAAQQAYNIHLPTHSCEWVGLFCFKGKLTTVYDSGSSGPVNKMKNIGEASTPRR